MKILGVTAKGYGKNICQDAISLKKYISGDISIFLFALADGAGSAENSHRGAEFITSEFTKRLCRYLRRNKHFLRRPDIFGESLRNIIKKSIKEVRDRLLEKSYLEGNPFESYASTFIGGVVISSQFFRKLIYLSIGDSALFAFKKNGDEIKLIAMNIPIKGEYPNTTVFLTSHIWEKVMILGEVNNLDYLFVSSDGLDKVFFKAKILDEFENGKGCPVYMKYIWTFEVVYDNLYKLLKGFEEGKIEKQGLEKFLSETCMNINPDDKSLILGVFK